VTSGFSENTASENQCRGTIPLFILQLLNSCNSFETRRAVIFF
jgi:hypothetical protein